MQVLKYCFTFDGRPQGINIVGIGMDGMGMRADHLDKKLSSWNESLGQKPKVAYVVPYPLFLSKAHIEPAKTPAVQPCPSNDVRNYIPSFRNTTSS